MASSTTAPGSGLVRARRAGAAISLRRGTPPIGGDAYLVNCRSTDRRTGPQLQTDVRSQVAPRGPPVELKAEPLTELREELVVAGERIIDQSFAASRAGRFVFRDLRMASQSTVHRLRVWESEPAYESAHTRQANSIGPTAICLPPGGWRQRLTGAGTYCGRVEPGRVTSKPARTRSRSHARGSRGPHRPRR
jgi:hypothetical protein